MERILTIIALIMGVNSVTFILCRLLENGQANLYNFRGSSHGVVNYLIAGTCGDPELAYSYLLDDDALYDSITLVCCNTLGWNPKKIAKQIEKDYDRRHMHGMIIFATSIGDMIVREAEKSGFSGLSIAINPISGKEMVQKSARSRIIALAIVCELLSFLLGWLAVIPLIGSKETGKVSLACFADQMYQMATRKIPRQVTRTTSGIILSAKDNIEDRECTMHVFSDTNNADNCVIVEVDAGHNAVAVDEEYEKGLDDILDEVYYPYFEYPKSQAHCDDENIS